jgi:hypothetical protein
VTVELELPYPSTSFAHDPILRFDGRSLTLELTFALIGWQSRNTLVFEPTRAYRYVAEPFCQSWHYDLAYDRVAEIEDSDWRRLVQNLAQPRSEVGRHFALAMDSWGCIEVLADTVRQE